MHSTTVQSYLGPGNKIQEKSSHSIGAPIEGGLKTYWLLSRIENAIFFLNKYVRREFVWDAVINRRI